MSSFITIVGSHFSQSWTRNLKFQVHGNPLLQSLQHKQFWRKLLRIQHKPTVSEQYPHCSATKEFYFPGTDILLHSLSFWAILNWRFAQKFHTQCFGNLCTWGVGSSFPWGKPDSKDITYKYWSQPPASRWWTWEAKCTSTRYGWRWSEHIRRQGPVVFFSSSSCCHSKQPTCIYDRTCLPWLCWETSRQVIQFKYNLSY